MQRKLTFCTLKCININIVKLVKNSYIDFKQKTINLHQQLKYQNQCFILILYFNYIYEFLELRVLN